MTAFHKDLVSADLHVPLGYSPDPLVLLDNIVAAYQIHDNAGEVVLSIDTSTGDQGMYFGGTEAAAGAASLQFQFYARDNAASAWVLSDDGGTPREYINLDTTNSAEQLTFGNSTTSPLYVFAGTNDVQMSGHLRMAETSKPTGVGGQGFVYTKDVSTVTELFYVDSSDNEIQLTSGGAISVTNTLQGAYDGGATILVADATPIAVTHTTTPGTTAYALTLSWSAVAYTEQPHGLRIDMSGAASLNKDGADTYGLNLTGITNAGTGNSIGVNVAGFDKAAQFEYVVHVGTEGRTSGNDPELYFNAQTGGSPRQGYITFDGSATWEIYSHSSTLVLQLDDGARAAVGALCSVATNSSASGYNCDALGSITRASGYNVNTNAGCSTTFVEGYNFTATANADNCFVMTAAGTLDAANCQGLGHALNFGHDACLLAGRNAASSAANQAVLGGDDTYGFHDFYLGQGVTATSAPTGVTLHATSGSGTDIDGGPFTIAAGQGTGAGVPGLLQLQVSHSLASGTTLQTLRTYLELDSSYPTTALHSGFIRKNTEFNGDAMANSYSGTMHEQGTGARAQVLPISSKTGSSGRVILEVTGYDPTAGDVYSSRLTYAYENTAGTLIEKVDSNAEDLDEDGTWSVAGVASGAQLQITFTGDASNTTYWTADWLWVETGA